MTSHISKTFLCYLQVQTKETKNPKGFPSFYHFHFLLLYPSPKKCSKHSCKLLGYHFLRHGFTLFSSIQHIRTNTQTHKHTNSHKHKHLPNTHTPKHTHTNTHTHILKTISHFNKHRNKQKGKKYVFSSQTSH